MPLEPDFNLFGAKDFFLEKSFSKAKDEFPYGGMWLFSGLQGSGKTLLMMHLVRKIMQEYPDAILCSDISIYGVPAIPYTGLEMLTGDRELNNGSRGIIFMFDEIQALFSSLESKNMSANLVSFWSQNRKNRRLIVGTSQRFTRIAKPIREQTSYLYHSGRPFLCFYNYQLYDGDDFDEDGKFTGEKPHHHFYIPSVKSMRMYNTLEVIRKERFYNDGSND